MIKYFKTVYFIIFLLVTCFLSSNISYTQENSIDNLRKNLKILYSSKQLDDAFLGIYIESLTTGEIIYRHNEYKFFMPASNMKLFTTAAALELLEPEFYYKTGIYHTGNIVNGVLHGDIYIRGSGDPSISGRFYDNDINKAFRDAALFIKKYGINEINGNIIGDDNYFDDIPFGYGWSWDDFPFWYSAQLSALSFNDNCVDFTVKPADFINEDAVVTWFPVTGYIEFENKIKTSPPARTRKIDFWRDLQSNKIVAQGNIQLEGKPYKEYITVDNPTLYTTMAFKVLLDSVGITVSGEVKDIDDIKEQPSPEEEYIFYEVNCKKITEINSPPIPELIKVVNKKSHNFYADMLLKTLGKEFTGTGSIKNGREVVEKFLSKFGIDPVNFYMYDGSGLSRNNLIKPSQIARLLRFMRRSEYFQHYYDSLPIAGIDGSLEERMLNTNCVNNIRAKTGQIQFVRALSGYATAKDNEEFLFVIIGNHFRFPVSVIEYIQDKTCEFLVNFNRKNIKITQGKR